MKEVFLGIFALIVGYGLGSIPVGVLIAKQRGVDLFEVGSGNIGTTNVLRVLGSKWAAAVFILDLAKGFAAVGIAWAMQLPPFWQALAGLAAIGGHNWSCFLQFRGGKGVATSLGVILGLNPLTAVVALAVWAVVVWGTRFVSLGSIVAAFCVPTLMGLFERDPARNLWFMLCGVVILLLALCRHYHNIGRLLSGTENRVGALVSAKPEKGRPVRARVKVSEGVRA